VVSHQPEEMIVRVGAGTTVAELASAVGEKSQMVVLGAPEPQRATVGGVLAVGRSGLHRLRYGPVRDCVLEATWATADGRLARAGGPLVKNVTGFDLCRLMVGSLGTLGLLAEVVLRCLPRPQTTRWWMGADVDPFALGAVLYRPLAVLWDGRHTWVGLAGHPADVASQADAHLDRLVEVPGPPPMPGADQRSLDPRDLEALPAGMAGPWLAEVGVGTVHVPAGTGVEGPALDMPALDVTAPDAAVVALNRGLKSRFDPTGRLNPGRDVLAR